MIRNSPTMQESWVWSLGWENQYSSEIPWTEEPGGLQPVGPQRVRHDWRTNKELGPTVVRLTDVKSARQDNRLETRAGADTAVWRQNPFFSRNPQEYLRRHSHPSMNFMRKETLRDRLCSDDLSRKSNLGRAFICHLALLRLNSSKTQLFKQFMDGNPKELSRYSLCPSARPHAGEALLIQWRSFLSVCVFGKSSTVMPKNPATTTEPQPVVWQPRKKELSSRQSWGRP